MSRTPPISAPAPLTSSGIVLEPAMELCQTDLPLDWYQEAFKPYAQEYLALPDRTPESILPWLDGYMKPAVTYFGDDLLLLAHFYMGGEIVKLIERYGGKVSDSYALALQAARNPQKKVIVESAVHFMAESIAILAHDDQDVWITNPKAGCTMEMMAQEWMVTPTVDALCDRYGDDLLVIAYMNTSGRLKAIAGRTGGAVCTSSNAAKIMAWALAQDRKVFFLPDRHLGRNAARALGLSPDEIIDLPDALTMAGEDVDLAAFDGGIDALDHARVINWGSYCSVHTIFRVDQVHAWQREGWRVLVHPESTFEVVDAADGAGSTAYLWNEVITAPRGAKLAIGTEGHFVQNAADAAAAHGVTVRHLSEAPITTGTAGQECGCATMSRNDPPHLAGMLDLLRQGTPPEINHVLAGDVIDEATGRRDRLDEDDRATLIAEAKIALDRMIQITEASP